MNGDCLCFLRRFLISIIRRSFSSHRNLLLGVRLKSKLIESDGTVSTSLSRDRSCACSCDGGQGSASMVATAKATRAAEEPYLNGSDNSGGGEMLERAPVVTVAAEWRTGASIMEQLVPEIMTHALSYLDYLSLCRLSMTSSLMRKAANDDNAWKALYHKDFTLEPDNITPVNGWKAYYAATRAIVNRNEEFFTIIGEKSLSLMSRLWLNADYVKCVFASGHLFTGYNAVMRGWWHDLTWQPGVEFRVSDVRARVLTDMAWVTMKTYFDEDTGPFIMTNIFEFHNGMWFLVHHHSSVMDQQILFG